MLALSMCLSHATNMSNERHKIYFFAVTGNSDFVLPTLKVSDWFRITGFLDFFHRPVF
jgi:hypothetical protein